MTCENCCEGKLIWKRKTKNVLGWVLRIYRCNECGLETRLSQFPDDFISIKVEDLKDEHINRIK